MTNEDTLLGLLADIRAAAGDREGRLMQAELVEHVRGLKARADSQAARIAELETENGKLETALDAARHLWGSGVCEVDRLESVNDRLRAELEALRADAERWRFWKPRLICADFEYVLDHQGFSVLVFEIPEGVQVSADLDKTTDAAIAARKGEGVASA